VHVIPLDDRHDGEASHPRVLPAFSVSMLAHAAMLLFLVAAFQRAAPAGSIESPASELSALTQLVWIPVQGQGGGGGGGGNRNPQPPARLQRAGRDSVSTPLIRSSVLDARRPEILPEPSIAVAALPLAADTLALPGAMDSTTFSTVSLGPGSRGLAGAGDNEGIGSGNGPGVDEGRGGNQGGGPNRPGAKIVLPAIIRDVRPQYTTEAMRARIQGAVLVRAVVQPDGTVRDLQVARSLDPVFGLDQAALRAAAQWLFRPAMLAGQPVPLAVTIELVFTLR
jgi:protein TonB